jgi:hypothetical protein
MTEIVPQWTVTPNATLIDSLIRQSTDARVFRSQSIMQLPEYRRRGTLAVNLSIKFLPCRIIIRRDRGDADRNVVTHGYSGTLDGRSILCLRKQLCRQQLTASG